MKCFPSVANEDTFKTVQFKEARVFILSSGLPLNWSCSTYINVSAKRLNVN